MNEWILFAIAAVVGFAVAFGLGYVVIPYLHKLHFGQTILDIGPSWHKNKQGTPTMGGVLFIFGTAAALIVSLLTDFFSKGDIIAGNSASPDTVKAKFWSGIAMALCFGMIGFLDDYIKVKRKENKGLSIKQKTALEIIVMCAYLASLRMAGATYIYFPFFGNVELKFFFWIFGAVCIYCTVNAVNFTDGIDGLCGSVTETFAVSALIIALLRGYFGTSLLCAAMFGSISGYLIWNWHPAKVFMGDVGSLFLGGIVVAVSYSIDMPWIIILSGIIYVIEFLSDVIQIVYFKATHGKRLFKMAPIHHHFEKCGWSEKKIVYIFTAINALGGLAAVLLTYFGQPK